MLLRVIIRLVVIVAVGGLGARQLLVSRFIGRRFFLDGFLKVAMDFDRQVDNRYQGQDASNNERDKLERVNLIGLFHVPHHHIFDLS